MAKQWDPFGEVRKVQKAFNKKVDSVFAGYKKPFSDIRHSANFVSIEVKLPEINKQDIKLVVDPGRIMVTAQTRKKDQVNSYQRTVYLPPGLVVEKAQARFLNGILRLHIPKSKLKKRIKIK